MSSQTSAVAFCVILPPATAGTLGVGRDARQLCIRRDEECLGNDEEGSVHPKFRHTCGVVFWLRGAKSVVARTFAITQSTAERMRCPFLATRPCEPLSAGQDSGVSEFVQHQHSGSFAAPVSESDSVLTCCAVQRIQPTKARDYVEFRQHYKFLHEAEGDAEVQTVKASEK